MLLGLGLLCLAEVALRLSGRFADPPEVHVPEGWDAGVRLVGDHLGPPLEAATVEGQPGRRTARRMVEDRFMHDLQWAVDAPADKLRIFTFGGSTTYGVPVEAHPEQTFPGRMRAWLERLGMPAQVLNLGGASFGSDEVVSLMSAVQGDGAAAFVVYAANNEFFQYQMRLFQDNAGYPTARPHLQRLHLFRALEALLTPDPDPAAIGQQDAVDHQEQVVARIIEASLSDPDARPAPDAQGRWHRRDPHHAAVVARYRSNLEQMERVAADADARLFIADVRPNLQQAPWLSLHDPALSAGDRGDVTELLAQGARAREAGDATTAEDAARQALRLDPMYAAAWHLLGMALLDQDRVDDAEGPLRNALELDMNPGRPVQGLSDAIAAVTADGGSTLVTVDRIWQAPDAGSFGGRLFHDSCHLTPEAYDKLGRHLAMTLRLELAEQR